MSILKKLPNDQRAKKELIMKQIIQDPHRELGRK